MHQRVKTGRRTEIQRTRGERGVPCGLLLSHILHASPADFKQLLQNREVKFEDFTDVAGIARLIKTLHPDWSP
ncbi:hypothetical protein JHK82_031943 [Glycine max]|nr:hypothetical protein JHK87_031880 [Glycine soja]KAG4989627.1 hypothetical protein JHK85_032610 [Glycine max]KAG4995214.1 hypothetical protein JHK86_032041 [Glycine max]KAG5125206.1 hypothetical protein JHK82_031943 [Glycine max]KAG5146632.1 hypothetical protein JHK84_032175 [Glycine max]